MNEILNLIGAITGVISLLGIIYIAGYWKGVVDAFMRQTKECQDKYPAAELSLMVKSLWDVYGLEAMSKRPDLAEHSSPWRLTPKGKDLIPDNLKKLLDGIVGIQLDHSGAAANWLVVKTLGLDRISDFARDTGLSLHESIGVLGIHLECLRQNCLEMLSSTPYEEQEKEPEKETNL